jgi:hypothetical protein
MRTARTFPALLVTIFAAALLIAGCGGEGGPKEPSEEQQSAIDTTFADYKTAIADKDADATCALIAPGSVDQIGGEEECVKVYDEILKAQGEALAETLDGYEVDRIEVAEDDSIARMYFVDVETPQRFQPDGDQWLIVPPDSLTGGAPTTE